MPRTPYLPPASVRRRDFVLAVSLRLARRLAASAFTLGLCLLADAPVMAQLQPGDLVRSLHIADGAGGFHGQLTNGNGFGSAVALLSDLDGNGVAELAVGAPADNDGGSHRGAVWILFRDAHGRVLRSQKISSTEGLFAGPLDDADSFGHALACVGDLDGDGLPELAVGAPGDDDGGSIIFPDPSVGAVWILYLQRDGKVRAQRKISATAGKLSGPLNELDRFGSSIAAMGDFGGDGVPDLAVGAPGDNSFGINAGAFWLLHLDRDGSVLNEVKNPLGGSAAGTGATLANIGDLNGDGTPDVATAGDLVDVSTGKSVGYAIVAFLDVDGTVLAETELTQPAGALDDFGSSIAVIPDLDGDGVVELAIGGHRHDDLGEDRGAVWIAYMLQAGFVKSYTHIDSSNDLFEPQLADGDRLGFAIASIHDDDGDGIPDLLVGAPGDDGFGVDRGAVWRLSLSDGKWNSHSPGLPGSRGTPTLGGVGPLDPGTHITLTVANAVPDGSAWLVVGSNHTDLPFLGGVLVPEPEVIRGPFTIDNDSTLRLNARWPDNIASRTTFYYQAWIEDASGPQGYAASNGLSSTTR